LRCFICGFEQVISVPRRASVINPTDKSGDYRARISDVCRHATFGDHRWIEEVGE
jgi:hypothetical protein